MYVIKAITKHIDQLLATITLVAIFIFIFANYLGRFYSPLFNPESVNSMEVCSTLKSCYFTTLNLGLRLGGGIAEAMLITDVESQRYNFYGKLIFDLGFFMFVNIICLNVIFGIIIDTFSELRAKQRERQWDEINNCDICGIQRKIFEKKGVEFVFHKKVEHNLWNYVFYLVYLHTLNENSLTGFDFFVLNKFRQRSTAWLPINSTLYLTSSGEGNEEFLELKQEMSKMYSDLEEKMEDRFAATMRGIREIRNLLINSRQEPSSLRKGPQPTHTLPSSQRGSTSRDEIDPNTINGIQGLLGTIATTGTETKQDGGRIFSSNEY